MKSGLKLDQPLNALRANSRKLIHNAVEKPPPPYSPARGLTYAQGPHAMYKKFLVFKEYKLFKI